MGESNALEVLDKWSGEPVGRLPVAGAGAIEAALASSVESLATPWAPSERAAALRAARDLFEAEREEILTTLRRESGFTIRDVEDEVARGLVTLELCAEEATRFSGETVSLGASSGFESRIAFTVRAPIGVVLAMTPFNTNFNGVLHKVGPALAAGNAVIVKPSELTPLTAGRVVDVLLRAGVPADRLHVLHGPGDSVALPLLRDPRVAFASFTGSTRVGAIVKAETGVRPVALELGSVGCTILAEDADLDRAASLTLRGGFRKAGQVCTSVQRLLVHDAVVEDFLDRLVGQVSALRAGDPADPEVDLGPVISSSAAERVERLLAESVAAGAEIATGGGRDGTLVEPTVVSGLPEDSALARQEVFGPVVAVTAVRSVEDGIARVNAGEFGLQAGVFSRSIATALSCVERLQVGAVIVNGTSSTRADGMPFGGQKASGFGKEGPRYAMRAMSVERLVMLGG